MRDRVVVDSERGCPLGVVRQPALDVREHRDEVVQLAERRTNAELWQVLLEGRANVRRIPIFGPRARTAPVKARKRALEPYGVAAGFAAREPTHLVNAYSPG